MKSCREYEKMFLEAYYKEIQPYYKEQFDKHVTNCARCKEGYSQLCTALDEASRLSRPDLSSEYWQQYWKRLEKKLSSTSSTQWVIEKRKIHWQIPDLNLRMAAVAIAVTFVLFLATVLFFRPFRIEEEPILSSESVKVDEVKSSINAQIYNYLNRSKVILMSLVNLEDNEVLEIDFQQHQKLSSALLGESKQLRQKIDSQDRVMNLVDDLDLVMMQIANQDSRLDKESVELIRSSVENKELLFKINIEKMVLNKPSLQKES
ncbi:hypothetical protein GF406_00035 [candidate division KSB1 bacterium]|nr:hypothetical protein [candidate division KSB1 bacterium]